MITACSSLRLYVLAHDLYIGFLVVVAFAVTLTATLTAALTYAVIRFFLTFFYYHFMVRLAILTSSPRICSLLAFLSLVISFVLTSSYLSRSLVSLFYLVTFLVFTNSPIACPLFAFLLNWFLEFVVSQCFYPLEGVFQEIQFLSFDFLHLLLVLF